MKWDTIRIHGLGPFVGHEELELSALPGPLVAIAGENGAGKSVLLELLPGALYRQTPTRGTLAELAVARDAYVEVVVTSDHQYTVRQNVDGANGKGETLILDASGAPVLCDAKVRTADAWMAHHMPSPEVLYASLFAPQGSGGFLDLRPAERKAVLLRVLGIERLEHLASAARERQRDARTDLTTLLARIADERARTHGVGAAAETLIAEQSRAARADGELAAMRAALDVVESAAEQSRVARDEWARTQERRAELDRELAAARSRQSNLAGRIADARRIIDCADDIRAAADRTKVIVAVLAGIAVEQAECRAQMVAIDAAAKREQQAAETASAQMAAAEERSRRAGDAVIMLRDVRAAVQRLPAARDDADRTLRDLRAAETARESLQHEHLATAEQRILSLRTAHELIRDGAQSPARIAADALRLDDEHILAARDMHERQIAAARAVAAGVRDHEQRKAIVAGLETQAARLSDLEITAEDMAAAQRDIAAATDARRSALAAMSDATVVRDQCLDRGRTLDERQRALDAERLSLGHDRVGLLAQAEARLEELEPQYEAATMCVAECDAHIRALPVVPEPAECDTREARRAVEQAELAARESAAAVAVAERTLCDARASADRLEALGAEQRARETALADWTRLAEDLGRDGLQALMIDAAGPELTALCTDLLHACIGGRWTIAIETQRASADGKRTIEGCEVRVIDSERGRDASAESLSGGERVLVGEAISLALSILACRRAGLDEPTLVRDETGAALDPTRGRAYIAMLRRAAAIVGARHILFVSHDPGLRALADSRVTVAGGRVACGA